MNIKELSRASYLDILFEGRNKTYGAYELRNHYSRRARNAVIGVAVFTSLLLAYPLLASKESSHVPKPFIKDVIFATIDKTPEKKIEPALPKPHDANPAPRTATVTNPPPRIVENDLAQNPPKPNEELAGKTISDHEADGTIGGPVSTITAPGGKGTGLVEQPKASTEPAKWVSQMPEFNGDVNTWLGDHLQYPEADRTEGRSGKTYLQFVVSEDGSISDVSIIRSAGSQGLDAEAVRVVRSMPRWKAGRNNGVPMKVWFKLAIEFALND